MVRAGVLLAVACLALPASLSASTARQPVRVGLSGPEFDGCSSSGAVRGIAQGRHLTVRAAPRSDAAAIGWLRNGREVVMCDSSPDGRWTGIVWQPADQPDLDCGAYAIVSTVRPYDGPCPSGWVASNHILLVAG